MLFIIGILAIILLLVIICEPKEPSGIVLYFANIGTGKTTYLSRIAQKELKKMSKGKSKYKYIVSNAQISGVKYIPNLRDLLKTGAIEGTLILFDEGSIEYNNRKMQMTAEEIKYYKLIRHYKSTLIVLSQSHDDIDVTLRRLYTQIYILRWLPFVTMIQPIKKRVGIDEITKQIIDEYRFTTPFSWRFFFRPAWFKYFNSWWVPSDISIHDLEKYKDMEYMKRPEKNKLGFLSKKENKKLAPSVSTTEGGNRKIKYGKKHRKEEEAEIEEEIKKVESLTEKQKYDDFYRVR